ncbi:hypothetical protein SOVF_083670 [Spinacia oleracea]|nr:hypothetical protein SOVF_083670 [Spinacia oleracea]
MTSTNNGHRSTYIKVTSEKITFHKFDCKFVAILVKLKVNLAQSEKKLLCKGRVQYRGIYCRAGHKTSFLWIINIR